MISSDLAIGCEPPLPLGSGNEKSQRTRLGKALVRMRDRVFQIDARSLRLEALGTSHKLQRWRLAFDEKIGTDQRTPRTPAGTSEGYVDPVGGTLPDNVHLEKHQSDHGVGVRGVRGVRFSNPYTCADARAPVKEDAGKRTPRTPRAPSACEDAVSGGVHAGVRLNPTSPHPQSTRLAEGGCAVMSRPHATGPPDAAPTTKTGRRLPAPARTKPSPS